MRWLSSRSRFGRGDLSHGLGATLIGDLPRLSNWTAVRRVGTLPNEDEQIIAKQRYAMMESVQVKDKPVGFTLVGERIVFWDTLLRKSFAGAMDIPF